MLFDVFISHASEDKDAIARPLAEKLRERRLEVWYDEFTLKVGDGLRRSIDRGLAQSRYGIVILSPAFFNKHWSQWELDGLVARQNAGDNDLILPVWHDVSRDDVLAFSPPLADKLATSTAAGLDSVVKALLDVIQPEGSTLTIARDHLIDRGWNPPVISDDWWLDVAAFAESNELEGGWQEPMGWGRWGFPLPLASRDPDQRGWRMARAAMQMRWQEDADDLPITQLTHPERVLEFIDSHPDLAEVCAEHIHYMVSYAPQMTIRGMGGQFESAIDDYYLASIERSAAIAKTNENFGTALTTNGEPPRCDEDFALRDPNFGFYDPASLTCMFVQGSGVANGPPVRYYPYTDYAAWLLSDASNWLPTDTRAILSAGMAAWGVWPWEEGDRPAEQFGFEPSTSTGSLIEELRKRKSFSTMKIRPEVMDDVVERMEFSAALLGLPESGNELAERVLSPDFLNPYFDERRKRQDRRRRR